MGDILFLAHRIPYPPDKGDKIRAWHVLQHLASRHRVHLGTFIDAPEDIRHVDRLKSLCASVFWRPLSPRLAALLSLRCLLNGDSLTQGYYGDARFHADVDRVVAQHKPKIFYVFSSAMAPYVAHHHSARVILDLVDVDSEKWRQYAQTASWPARFIYAREGRTLLALERQAARHAQAVTFVTSAEAMLFTALAPEAAAHVHCVGNGVNADYFNPSLKFANPFDECPAIVFTGAMDYRPNVDAMTWFVSQVMPRLRAQSEALRLWIVGSNPSRAVLDLAGPDVCVTGRVPDVRPYLRHARVVVAPLRIARGIQNKVLEAMAMEGAAIVTPQIRKTLDHCRDDEILTAATPDEFADATVRILSCGRAQIGVRARQRVVRDYTWETSFAALDQLIEMKPHKAAAVSGTPLSTVSHDVVA